MSGVYRNGEGYFDPTAGAVLRKAEADEAKARKTQYRPLVYIVSPFAGDTKANIAAALERLFRSGWYRTLTAVDREMLIEKLRKEAGV